MARRNPTLKLLVDTKDQRVLFAEAGKDVVDFLFSLLALPVGTAARLLSAHGMVGSLGKLYESVKRMNGTYLQAGFERKVLLNPTIASNTSCQNVFLLLKCSQSSSVKYYRCDDKTYYDDGRSRRCSNWGNYVTVVSGTPCPDCKRPMTAELTYVPPKAETVAMDAGGGFVKEVVTYMVMDDLTVQPMSAISSITLLNKFHITEVGSLEERTVKLGMEEGLRLLKASFQSKTVLTDVFLGSAVSLKTHGGMEMDEENDGIGMNEDNPDLLSEGTAGTPTVPNHMEPPSFNFTGTTPFPVLGKTKMRTSLKLGRKPTCVIGDPDSLFASD